MEVGLNEKRVVLFPNGQPAERDKRDACISLVICAGGDLDRIHDGPWHADPDGPDAEAGFLRYISRIQEVVNGTRPPLVVLTRTNPLPLAVLAKRRRICAALRNLNRAIWVLFVDPSRDPFFCSNASRLGEFETACQAEEVSAQLCVWSPDSTQRSFLLEQYVVWHPQTVRDKDFKERLAKLAKELELVPSEPVTQTRLRAAVFPDEPVSSRRRY
jgi:hypothetical protein